MTDTQTETDDLTDLELLVLLTRAREDMCWVETAGPYADGDKLAGFVGALVTVVEGRHGELLGELDATPLPWLISARDAHNHRLCEPGETYDPVTETWRDASGQITGAT